MEEFETENIGLLYYSCSHYQYIYYKEDVLFNSNEIPKELYDIIKNNII